MVINPATQLTPLRKSPMTLLRELDKRARAAAPGLPRQAEARKAWSGIAFRLARNYFVAPLLEVREILSYPVVTPVPGAKPWVKGIANVRGNLIPIIHLQSYLHKRTEPMARRSRVLVIRQEGIFAGLVVDEVLGMKHFREDEFGPALARTTDAHDYGAGACMQDGRQWEIFSMQRLAQSELFLQAAV